MLGDGWCVMRVMGVSYVLVVTTVRSSTTSSCVLSALTRLSVSLYFLHSLQAPTIYHLLTLHTLYLLWHLALSGRTSRLWGFMSASLPSAFGRVSESGAAFLVALVSYGSWARPSPPCIRELTCIPLSVRAVERAPCCSQLLICLPRALLLWPMNGTPALLCTY